MLAKSIGDAATARRDDALVSSARRWIRPVRRGKDGGEHRRQVSSGGGKRRWRQRYVVC